MTVDSKAPITPEMKVSALLDAHPQLEEVLIELAPAFKKLRNPVLRKTVAKVATLERAAGIAGIPVRDLVLRLRSEIGQPTAADDPSVSPAPTACGCFHPSESEPIGVTVDNQEGDAEVAPPVWFHEDRVSQTIDAAAMLAAGQIPVGPVMQAARSLGALEILRVTVDFKPVPMIEMLAQRDLRTYCRQIGPDRFELFAALSEYETGRV
jgi:hypothetical protein